MFDPSTDRVTELTEAATRGDEQAARELTDTLYDELRRLARIMVARRGGPLQPTELFHEAYVKLVGQREDDWNGASHFISAAVLAMRRVLIDLYRKRKPQELQMEVAAPAGFSPEDLLTVQEVIAELEKTSARQAQILDLRVTLGKNVEQTARLLGISERTVKREWRFLSRWLYMRVTDRRNAR